MIAWFPREILVLVFQFHRFWTQKNVYHNYFKLASVSSSWNDALKYIRQTHRELFQRILQEIIPVQRRIPVQPGDYRWRWTARLTEQYFDSYFYKARRFLEISGISDHGTAKLLSTFMKRHFRQVRIHNCAWHQKLCITVMCWKPKTLIDIA